MEDGGFAGRLAQAGSSHTPSPANNEAARPVPRLRETEFLRRLAGQLGIEPGERLDFEDVRRRVPRTQFAFFLGAGCSASSGVLTAHEVVVREWLPKVSYHLTGDRMPEDQLLKWADSCRDDPCGEFEASDPAASYGPLFSYLFPQAAEARKETRRLVSQARPSAGYLALAELLQWEGLDCTITTNFDDLIAHATVISGYGLPRIYGHDAAYADYDPNVREPVVLKVHGDAHLEPRHTRDQTASLPLSLTSVVHDELRRRGLIVVGYGGRDSSIMSHLLGEVVSSGRAPHPWYWCVRTGDTPSPSVLTLMANAGGHLVEIDTFDDFLTRMAITVGIQENKIYDRLRALTERYRSTLLPQEVSHSRVVSTAVQDPEDWFSYLLDSRAEETVGGRVAALREGVNRFPDNIVLLRSLGWQLVVEMHDLDSGLSVWKEIVALPDAVDQDWSNYATVLQATGRVAEAEPIYERLIAQGSDDPVASGNLGCLLVDANRDVTRAEILLRRALRIPTLDDSLRIRYLMYLIVILPAGESLYEVTAVVELLLKNTKPYVWWDWEPLLARPRADAALSFVHEIIRATQSDGLASSVVTSEVGLELVSQLLSPAQSTNPT